MLSPQDRARVESDAFSRNLHDALGGASAQALNLKTQLDVAQMELGVARDLIAAKDAEIAEKDKALHDLTAKLAGLERRIEADRGRVDLHSARERAAPRKR